VTGRRPKTLNEPTRSGVRPGRSRIGATSPFGHG
jgi:hypothetical protein